MEDFINIDLFNCYVIKYLPPLSLYNLKLTSKLIFKGITRSHIKTSIIHQINLRLSLLFEDKLIEFKKVMNDTKAIISGSFIIQCILEEYWVGCDIDIYFPTIGNKKYHPDYAKPYYEIEKYLYENMKFKLNDSFEAISGYGLDQSNGKVNIKYVRTYDISIKIKNIKEIQVIQIKINNNFNDIIRFIRDTHDFDICKNVYYIEKNIECINIFKLMDILTKTTEFKIGFRLGASIERSKKYSSRGFNMINNMSYTEIANRSHNLKFGFVNINFTKKQTTLIEGSKKFMIYNVIQISENQYEILDDVVIDKNSFFQCIEFSRMFIDGVYKNFGDGTLLSSKRGLEFTRLYVKGDNFRYNDKKLEIIRQNKECYESCLLKFCNSHEKHICYCNDNQQTIFIIKS